MGEGGIRVESSGPILAAVVQADEMECRAGNSKTDDLVPQQRNMGIVREAGRNSLCSRISIMVAKAGKDPVPGVERVQIREEVRDIRRIGIEYIAGQENEVWPELIDPLHIGFEFLGGEIRPDMEITDMRNGYVRTCGGPMGKGEFYPGYAELALASKVAIDEKAGNEHEAHTGKELKALCQHGLHRQVQFCKGEEEAAYGDEEREECPEHSTQDEKNKAKGGDKSRGKINPERETEGCGQGGQASREAQEKEIQAKKDRCESKGCGRGRWRVNRQKNA